MSTQNVFGDHTIDALSHYRHAEVLRDGGIFYGPKTYVLRGQNLHMLLPYFMCDVLPSDFFESAREGKLLMTLPQPLQICVESVLENPDEIIPQLVPLGRPLHYTIPKGSICDQWFLLESAGFVAVHRQQDFVFLTKSTRHCLYYIKFAKQAYVLVYAEKDHDPLWTALRHGFPKYAGRPNQEGEKNVFSVYPAPACDDHMKLVSHRFPRFTEISKISDDEIDQTELPAMPTSFNPMGITPEDIPSLSTDLPSNRRVRV